MPFQSGLGTALLLLFAVRWINANRNSGILQPLILLQAVPLKPDRNEHEVKWRAGLFKPKQYCI